MGCCKVGEIMNTRDSGRKRKGIRSNVISPFSMRGRSFLVIGVKLDLRNLIRMLRWSIPARSDFARSRYASSRERQVNRTSAETYIWSGSPQHLLCRRVTSGLSPRRLTQVTPSKATLRISLSGIDFMSTDAILSPFSLSKPIVSICVTLSP